MSKPKELRTTLSWALYDWGNSAFATTVMAGFFPVFFKKYWSFDVDVTTSTFHLGMANSLASIMVALLAPVLGAISDRGSARKRFLLFFASLGIATTGTLYWVAKGQWEIAAALYIMAVIGFSGGNIFYDSLLVDVASEDRRDWISALGFSLGYLGGGLLFAFNVFMTLKPELFGLAHSSHAVRISFVSVALWWAVFSIPIFLFVHERKYSLRETTIPGGFRQLAETFKEIRRWRVVFVFLLAYWLYIDGVGTVIRMAVDFGLSLGFSSHSLMVALLVTQIIGFPAAVAFGKLGEKLGAKTGIFIGIGVYLGVTIWAYGMETEWEFYVLACLVGLVQGGVQALSRSLYSRIIPRSRSAEFFGFYNMLGKFAAVVGPFLMGWVSLVTGSPRLAIVSVALLFLGGGTVLYFVDEKEGRRVARESQSGFF
jgi:UMF1 family MFS transporter